jgi:cytochrome c553
MNKPGLRWVLWGLGGLAAVVAIGLAGLFAASEAILDRSYAFSPVTLTPGPGGSDVNAGAGLARVFGCDDCHGADLRGRLLADIPMLARIGTPNLTLLAKTYSDAQLALAIRSGVRPDGRAMLGMPSAVDSRLTDQEVASVIAYLRAKPAGGEAGEGVRLGLLGRLVLVTGKVQTEPQRVAAALARPLPGYGPRTAPGRALARPCAECHGPDLTGDIGPDLRVATAYDIPAFARLLRTGIGLDGKPVKPVGLPEEKGKSLGVMAEVSPRRFGGLSDSDIVALRDYLGARRDHLKN